MSNSTRGKGTLGHLAAAGIFALLAAAWSFPLLRHVTTHLPGPGAGDNVNFLWNFWWMRTALASGQDVFYTKYLFVPVGANLTLHTHTALPAFIGATALGGLPVLAAQNVMILAALFLNGFCAYLLVWRLARDRGAAIIGGFVFSGSPYIAAHLNGHFNLTTAWTLPLFAIAATEAVKGSKRWAAAAGLMLALTAYIDYYYVVYETAFALCAAALAAGRVRVTPRSPTPRSRLLTNVVAALIVIDAAAIAVIIATGGVDVTVFGRPVSVHGTFNPAQAFWILVLLFLWLRLRPRLEVRRSPDWSGPRALRSAVLATIVFIAGAAPLVWKGTALLVRSEYVTQRYFWRSAPKGVDVATLVLGNPFHGIWGSRVQAIYRKFGIDPIEASAWFGVVPLALAAWLLASRGFASPIVRNWTVIGLIFFVWSLGPHLMAFGVNTGMILPQALLPYVPLVDNARVPGRAVVVSYLALAVLSGIAAAELRRRRTRGGLALAAIGCVLFIDYLPAPVPLVAMDRPRMYETLRHLANPGAVLELPLGLRHGLGERGAFDDRVLFYQTIHQRPLAGGFVARLPAAVGAAYETDPLLAALLALSDRRSDRDVSVALPDAALAEERLRAEGIGFVVLNRNTAAPVLVDYVDRVLPLTLVVEEGGRTLFRVGR